MAATLILRLTANGAATWTASTAYSVGALAYPTTKNGFVYECTVAGTSGATEPTWPTTEGDTVTDGTVTWQAVAEPNNSLGGTAGTTQVSSTALNNIFDDVTAAEATAGDVEYRAIDLYNSGDAAATAVNIWISSETTSPDTQLDMGIEASPVGSTTSIADESTAPTGVTFAHYTSASKLSVPDIPAGSYARVWIKRTVTAGATNTSNDQGTIAWEYA